MAIIIDPSASSEDGVGGQHRHNIGDVVSLAESLANKADIDKVYTRTEIDQILDGITVEDALEKDPTSTTGLSRNSFAAGNVVEVKDGATGVVKYGRSMLDGQPTINGAQVRERMDWFPGDPDPTAAGPLPSWVVPHLYLGADDPIPAWVAGLPLYLLDRETESAPPSAVAEFQYQLTGVANGTTVDSSTAGTGDDALVSVTGTPSVVTGDVVSPAVDFTVAADMEYLETTVTADTERRARFFLKTPPAWLAATATIFDFRNGASLCSRVSLAGSSSAGVMRMSNSANGNALATPTGTLTTGTWYRIEASIKQAATATDGTVRLQVYNMAGVQVFDSGDTVDATGAPVGYGTSHDTLRMGITAANTGTLRMARWLVTNDADLTIGA